MRKTSLRYKLLVPLLVGGWMLGLLGSWIAYRTAYGQLRNEFVRRGTLLASSIIALVNTTEGRYQGSVGALRLAIEDFIRLEPNVLALMIATKEPFIILVSTTHNTIDSDPTIGQRLTDLHRAIDEGRFGHYFNANNDLTLVVPLRPQDLPIGTSPVPEAVSARPDGGTERRFPPSAYRGAVLLRLDWAGVQRASTVILWRAVLTTVMNIGLLLVFVYMLIRRTVLRPIATLQSTIEQQRAGHSTARVPSLTHENSASSPRA